MLNISMDFLYINIINFGGIYIMIDKVMKETENEIMKGVTDEEREVVKRVSGKMWDNLNRLLENK